MPSVKTLKQLNAISGLAFAVFVVIHFACHYSLTLGGWETANNNLIRFRVIYQNPVFELLMFLSVLVHGYANVSLKLMRDKIAKTSAAHKKNDDDGVADVATSSLGSREYFNHRVAGYLVGILLIPHVIATRIVPAFVLKDPSVYDYSFFSIANDKKLPYNLFLAMECFFAMAGGWHTIYGTWSAINTLRGHSVAGKVVPLPLRVLALCSHLLIISAGFAIAGGYYPVDKTSKLEYFEAVDKAMG